MGDLFRQTGLELQIQVTELLLQPFILLLLKHGHVVGLAPGIKTARKGGIMPSLACGDAEWVLFQAWKSIYIPSTRCF